MLQKSENIIKTGIKRINVQYYKRRKEKEVKMGKVDIIYYNCY